MMRIYLALGSNLGDRENYLRSGILSLANRDIHIIRCASLYSTEPREIIDQPWFLNTAIEGTTILTPGDLLETCLEIEKDNHRTRDGTKGPRTLDVDIIFYGNETIRTTGLTIPHPSFSARRFVLAPLAEIAPDFVDPVSGKTVSQLLETCPDRAEVRQVGPLQEPS
ncbi:MAG TPA: 2-amino-4-hydroxy-6-hydroxymethyldihydropteridine diphosphokinase [Terriglobia bacterium]|nr:2-amino-4-hydroxy-6-hydroxymethyldihydropteridine diphosphokinase [Terriglobia bacterium]